MKRWGVVVTTFYLLVVLCLILPSIPWLADGSFRIGSSAQLLRDPMVAVYVVLLIASEAILVFLSVDTSARRPARRSHIAVTATAAAIACGLLLHAGIAAVDAAAYGDTPSWLASVGPWIFLGVWAFWGGMFYRYARRTSITIDRVVLWLLRGSVLELLVAIPCHMIARRRQDCCATVFTAYGIATGTAVMLMAFGPGVLFLYQRRLERLWRHKRGVQPPVV